MPETTVSPLSGSTPARKVGSSRTKRPSALPDTLGDYGLSHGELGPAEVWRRTVDHAIEARAHAVVLAGDPDYERTRTAVRLWHEGQVSLLIMTGGEPGPGDSATSLREVAVRLGVPRGQIRMEQVSRSRRWQRVL